MSKCDCNDNRKVLIVFGNDLTVEAMVSVWDAKECVYVPMDLTGASDVALNMVTTFTKVPGEEVSASGSRVSAFFPAGRLGKGVYGVEITFRDADGRCRAFERSLIEVVESSGEATVESTAEGETGDGLNITVDVRTRTLRIGGAGATDYPSLTGKPSINGVVLEGNMTPEELGMYSRGEADEKFETKTQAAAALEKKADKTAITPYDISWIYNYISGKEDIPEDKYNEIKKVIDDNRFFILKEGVMSAPLFGNYNGNGILLWGANSPSQPAFITISILNYKAGDDVIKHRVNSMGIFPLEKEPSNLNNDSTVTYSGNNDAVYVAKSGEEITNLKVTCTLPADPVNPTMDYPKTREAKLIFECGRNADITFENVQWNDWSAPDFKTASHCICEISIMYVYSLKKFIGKYTTYPPTHLTYPSWNLPSTWLITAGGSNVPSIQVTDTDNVGWKVEYPDWMKTKGGIDSGTGSGTVTFQVVANTGAEREGNITLKSADGRKVFVECYVRQEGV